MSQSTAERILTYLQAFDLKQEGQGRYRSNSPLRPGSNSHAFTLTIHDGEHGAWKDHASEEQGSLYELAKLLNIALPEKDGQPTTKRKYTGMVDYARAHGIDPEELAAAGWRAVSYQNRLALEFITQTGKRWRFLDGEKPYYKSETGYKKCWYGAAQAMGKLSADKPLIIANGEISVVAAHTWGLPALCVTGGESTIPPELLTELTNKLWLTPGETSVIIALDCDDKGRAAARQMRAQFAAVGYRVRAVNMRLDKGGDLADFCMLHEYNSLEKLKECPDLPEDSKDDATEDDADFEIIDILDFEKLPPVEWIIPSEIPARGFVTIFGESNVGKSFIALDYALRIACSRPVLYIALEGESGIPLRVFGWCQHHRIAPDALHFKMMVGYISFFDKEEMEKLSTALNEVKPYVVVVDTFGLVMGSGDENSASNVNQVMKATRRIQKKLDCTIIFIHHTNKGGIQERGSGALRGRMDTMIQVLPDDDLIRVESSKTRDQKAFEPKSIKLLPVQVEGKGETLVPVPAEMVIRGPGLTPDQRKILEVMAMPVHNGGISQRDLVELGRMPYSRVVRSLSNLIDKGMVAKPKNTRESARITNDGRMAIGLDPIEGDEDEAIGSLDHESGPIGSRSKSKSSLKKPIGSLDQLDHVKSDPDAMATSQKTPDPIDPIDPMIHTGENADVE